ncbi:MAG: hypothetical protein HRT61_20635, partial [Ekhidna sp.]|nr:hypothetical protein [Ekhidna sp.]
MTENDHMQTFETDRLREICAVIATGIGKFVFMDWLQWQFPFIALSIISWISYIWYRTRSTPSLLRHWGFRKDNFARTLKLVLPFGLFAVGSFIVVGFIQDTLNPSWHIFPILIIYPVWGVIQQFLVIGLIAGNLQGM